MRSEPDTDSAVAPAGLDRKAAMAVLARATPPELAGPIEQNWPALVVRDLKPVEIGLVMLRGRIGGDGRAFNLGEATMTRAVISLADGRRGYGQVLGRDKRKARFAAIADALWLGEADRATVEREIIGPVAARLAREQAQKRAETAATKVDFFTLVRGED